MLSRPKVILVEESSLFVSGWQEVLDDDVELRCFDCPSAFRAFAARHLAFVKDAALIILDHKFANERGTTGLELAEDLNRQLTPAPPMVMSSDELFTQEDLAHVAGEVGKMPQPWSVLQRFARQSG